MTFTQETAVYELISLTNKLASRIDPYVSYSDQIAGNILTWKAFENNYVDACKSILKDVTEISEEWEDNTIIIELVDEISDQLVYMQNL